MFPDGLLSLNDIMMGCVLAKHIAVLLNTSVALFII